MRNTAQLPGLRRMVLRQGITPVLMGLVAGTITALLAGRLVKSLLFSVSAFDPLTIACVTSVILIVALAACWIPAQRAMKVDPMVALRYE